MHKDRAFLNNALLFSPIFTTNFFSIVSLHLVMAGVRHKGNAASSESVHVYRVKDNIAYIQRPSDTIPGHVALTDIYHHREKPGDGHLVPLTNPASIVQQGTTLREALLPMKGGARRRVFTYDPPKSKDASK